MCAQNKSKKGKMAFSYLFRTHLAITISAMVSDGTIYRIVSNIAILIHIVAYLYRDNHRSNEVDIPHNSQSVLGLFLL